VLVAAAPASGAPADDLALINTALNDARQALPETVGGSIAAEAQAIAKLEAVVAQAHQALTPVLASEVGLYDGVGANLADLESWLSHLRASHGCNTARQRILAAHAALIRAPALAWTDFGAAISTFSQAARADGRADVEFYHAQLNKLRQADDEVEALAKKKAEQDTASAHADKVASLVAAAYAKLAVLKQRNATYRPMTEDVVTELDNATRVLAAEDADAAAYFADALVFFRLELRWTQPSPSAETAIAADLGGAIMIKGVARAKTLTVRGKAKGDNCYVLIAHFNDYAGDQTISGVEWSSSGRGATVQDFALQPDESWRGPWIYGFCGARSAAVSAKLVLNGKPKTGLRYVIVELGRDTFPRAFAARLAVMPVDYCDKQAWEQWWALPVPGTIAYFNSEPVLVQMTGGDVVTYITTGNANPQQALLTALESTAPTSVSFVSPVEPRACPNDGELGRARALLSQQIVRCQARVAKRLAARGKAIGRERAAAESQGLPTTAADAKAQDLAKDLAEATMLKCGRLADKAKDQFAKSRASLQVVLGGRRYQDPTRRVAVLRAYARVQAAAPQGN